MPQDPADHSLLRLPDAGGRLARTVALVALIAVIACTFVLQQMTLSSRPAPAPSDPAAQPAPEPDPGSVADPRGFAARVAIKLGQLLPHDSELRKAVIGPEPARPQSAQDLLRSIIIAADLLGADEGLKRLERLKTDQDWAGGLLFDPDLAGDAEVLRRIYEAGPGMVPKDQLSRLEIRHGWFGRIAAVFGQNNHIPERAALVGGGVGLAATLGAFGVALVIAIVGGITCFVIALIKLTSRRVHPEFVPPAPGGSVYLETIAIFLGAFIALSLAVLYFGPMVLGNDPTRLTIARLLVPWLMVPIVLWPVARGVPLNTWRQQMGLTTGRGIAREIASGLFVYLAAMPLLALAFLVVFVGRSFDSGSSSPPDAGPSGGGGGHGSPFEILSAPWPIPLLLFLLGTVWAPIVEECVFRGALVRHMRTRTGPLLAALGSALVFGLVHPYQWYQLAPVMTLGFAFAVMRQWRGSLLPSMAMHSLSNAVVLGLVWGLVKFAAD